MTELNELNETEADTLHALLNNNDPFAILAEIEKWCRSKADEDTSSPRNQIYYEEISSVLSCLQ